MKKTNKIIALVLAVITLLSVVCVVPVTASAKVINVWIGSLFCLP